MRILLTILTVVFALTLFTTTTLAQDSSRSANKPDASRAATLKARLAQFRDQKKADKVSRINETLAMINKKRTDMMLKFLNNAERILGKLETRVNDAGTKGKDTTQAKAAITDAKKVIADARAAVVAQAAKTYTINVSSETTVRADAKTARDQLHNDLQSVRTQVQNAKKAVANAIRVAATTLGGTK